MLPLAWMCLSDRNAPRLLMSIWQDLFDSGHFGLNAKNLVVLMQSNVELQEHPDLQVMWTICFVTGNFECDCYHLRVQEHHDAADLWLESKSSSIVSVLIWFGIDSEWFDGMETSAFPCLTFSAHLRFLLSIFTTLIEWAAYGSKRRMMLKKVKSGAFW